MPDIAGYADLAYIKGHYYRYAAAPKPVVYTGNIDTISDALLIKAMFVSRNSASGTFPNDFGNTFLITTVKYGDNAYLQTAYMIQENYECWEYRRIYNGSWTEWIGVDSAIKDAISLAQNAKDAADSAAQLVETLGGSASTIASDVNTIKNVTLPGLNTTVNGLSGRMTTVENKTANCGKSPVKLYEGELTSGSIYLPYGQYSSYLMVAKVQNKTNASLVTQLILKAQITDTNVSYCISDEVYWLSYYLRYGQEWGTTTTKLIVTFRDQYGSGRIRQVWGIY